jgi:hypothetical protein
MTVGMWTAMQRPAASGLLSRRGHGFLPDCPQKFNEPG